MESLISNLSFKTLYILTYNTNLLMLLIEIKGAATSAATKALDTLTIAIRNTINAGLKTVKDAMKINPNDTPISPEQSTSEVKSK
ncbi:variable large family protein (plasmid) [Borrelia nietonii YOR]|nr:variable large family protein [Borrelia nietonii YOR]